MPGLVCTSWVPRAHCTISWACVSPDREHPEESHCHFLVCPPFRGTWQSACCNGKDSMNTAQWKRRPWTEHMNEGDPAGERRGHVQGGDRKEGCQVPCCVCPGCESTAHLYQEDMDHHIDHGLALSHPHFLSTSWHLPRGMPEMQTPSA